ncbi:asparagine synthetase B family protein [Nocardia gipuzkoensis]
MCGIGGILTKTCGGIGAGADGVRQLEASLGRRGRSGRGAFIDEHVSLHCARHAVIAVDAAHQPLHDLTGDLVMVGNGEVLNYRDLAAQLPLDRRRCLPPGDLQVALELFATAGSSAFERLRGPFALAVWDRVDRQLTLVRDRLGERPLYYYNGSDVFMFASEVRCIEAALNGRLNLDEASILSFIGLGRTIGDRTLFKEIKAVPPGGVLQIDVQGGGLSHRSLAPIARLHSERDGSTGEDEILALLDQANRRALTTDCPVTVGFSGGIDSSVVLKAALDGAEVAAVITVFSATEPSEDVNLHRARAMAKLFGIDLLEVPFTLPSMDDTVELLNTTLDQPSAEPLVLHNDALHATASIHAPVMLGGHGADEVFGGYARYAAVLADRNRSATQQWMNASLWERWRRTSGWKQLIEEVIDDDFAAAAGTRLEALGRPFPYDHVEDTDPVLFGQALDLFRLMSHDNFRVPDENGIARGVEVRSPFFDIDLIASVFALPVHQRIAPPISKHLLHRVFAGTPLEQAFTVGKVGFDDHFPYPKWIADNSEYFCLSVTEGALASMGVMRHDALRHFTELDWRLQWRLFALSMWLARQSAS